MQYPTQLGEQMATQSRLLHFWAVFNILEGQLRTQLSLIFLAVFDMWERQSRPQLGLLHYYPFGL